MLPRRVIDVDDPDLLLPGNMPARINAQLNRIGAIRHSEGPGTRRQDDEPDSSQSGRPLRGGFGERGKHHREKP